MEGLMLILIGEVILIGLYVWLKLCDIKDNSDKVVRSLDNLNSTISKIKEVKDGK